MTLNSKTYDVLKTLAIIILPALAALYVALATIWGLPFADKIVLTITAINTAIGGLLKLSSKNYVPTPDAKLVVDESTGVAQIDLSDVNPADLVKKKAVTLAVVHPEPGAPPLQPVPPPPAA